VERFGAVLWALFFLIPVGRARADRGRGAEEIETVLRWAADRQPRVPFGIKTTGVLSITACSRRAHTYGHRALPCGRRGR